MKISQIFVYPVKSLRGISLSESKVTPQGLAHDRRFMLLKVESTSPRIFKNMHVAYFPELTLFFTEMLMPGDEEGEDEDDTDSEREESGTIIVRYRPPGHTSTAEDEDEPLYIPLDPSIRGLEEIDVRMHDSPTKAYDMGRDFNDWFSFRLGYSVVLAYIGPNLRPILGNLSPKAAATSTSTEPAKPKRRSWLSSLTSYLPALPNPFTYPTENIPREGLTFADAAAILVASETSLHDVSRRLPEGQEMDITKFRPNIVVSSADGAWDEDLWGEITATYIGDGEEGEEDGEKEVRIILTQNCARCQSINIDYATGKPGLGEQGKVLKMLMKDRRVDPGTKYSPIFGRYGFLGQERGGVVRVGDEVVVSKRNAERTKFDWPALNN